ncbi:HAD family phosphatase [Lactobacillus halodurans]|uniref:HAD family phosphatase n=1 Tax=Companilactobacillus halodurans TaxID=2584183 RepID=A0A5P0ZKV5_9LACO|nr:Cof-type HAD-IIB family hydrolase [Companilactobacillus halodurans]MQS74874.1 HAD family phosphatase [Companilactobacillus halodurans]
MAIKLVAMDIDDTLLDDEKQISSQNKETIQQALKNGVKVVLSSGRTFNGMVEYLNKLGISGDNQYIIIDGGGVVQTISGKIIYQKTLSNQAYREIDNYVQENNLHYNAVDVLGNTYTSNNDFIDKYTILQAFENNKGLKIKTPDQLPKDFEIVKAILNEDGEKLDAITEDVLAKFGQKYYVVRTDLGFLEIMPKNVDKSSALVHLADYLKIDLKDTLAIGDGENDIPMLKKAGIGVAMENASSKIKNLADRVTDDNNQSGVARAFEKYVLN